MLLLRHYCVAVVMSNTVVVTLSHALTKWPAQESGFQIADTVVYKEQEDWKSQPFDRWLPQTTTRKHIIALITKYKLF